MRHISCALTWYITGASVDTTSIIGICASLRACVGTSCSGGTRWIGIILRIVDGAKDYVAVPTRRQENVSPQRYTIYASWFTCDSCAVDRHVRTLLSDRNTVLKAAYQRDSIVTYADARTVGVIVGLCALVHARLVRQSCRRLRFVPNKIGVAAFKEACRFVCSAVCGALSTLG